MAVAFGQLESTLKYYSDWMKSQNKLVKLYGPDADCQLICISATSSIPLIKGKGNLINFRWKFQGYKPVPSFHFPHSFEAPLANPKNFPLEANTRQHFQVAL